MTCGSAHAACTASAPDTPTTNHSHRRPPGDAPFCKQTFLRDLVDMKPPYDQRPRWSAPIARTETPKLTPLFHAIRRPEDRRSMHPPRPREAERVARWLSSQGG